MVKSKVFFLNGILFAVLGLVSGCSSDSTNPVTTPETIYVTLYSHNEEGDYWATLAADEKAYQDYRRDLIEKVTLIKSYGAILNWESDYSVLLAMAKHEKGSLLDQTNNKNLLKWMIEDMGMVVDPHGHLTTHNLADIGYLIEQLGVKPSGVLGGFALYKCGTDPKKFPQTDILSQLEMSSDGTIKGRKFPSYQWKAKILGQPAMQGHAYDEFSSGAWRPDISGNFLDHKADGQLMVIGQGYPHYQEIIGAKNSGGTTIWYNKAGYITELAAKLKAGELPSGKIYTASVHLRDSSIETKISGIKETLETLKPLAAAGSITYLDYESVAKIWQEKYSGQPNRVDISSFAIYGDLIKEVMAICQASTKPPDGGKCGDGICDDIEKQTGLCEKDCN